MDSLVFALNTVAPICLVTAIGYLLVRLGVINESFADQLSVLAFKLLLPMAVFKEIYNARPDHLDVPFILFGVGLILGLLVAAMVVMPILFKGDPRRSSAAAQAVYRCNYVMAGLPIIQNMLSPEHALPAYMIMPFSIAAFNVGAVIIMTVFSGGEKKVSLGGLLLGIIKSPFVIAVALGGLAAIIDLRLPVILERTVSSIAATATAMALMALGGQFNFSRAVANLRVSLPVALGRLLLVPAVMLGISIACGWRGGELATILTLFATPSAAACYPYAKIMGSDAELTSELVLLTTMLSGFTLFCWIFGLRFLGLV